MTPTNIIAAYYDGLEWVTIDTNYLEQETSPSELSNIARAIQQKSKRSSLLHGIFYNPNYIGGVILDNPQILYLQGVQFVQTGFSVTPLEIIETKKGK